MSTDDGATPPVPACLGRTPVAPPVDASCASVPGGTDRQRPHGVLWHASLLTMALAVMGAGHADPRVAGQAAPKAGVTTGTGVPPIVENQGGFGRITLPSPVRGAYGLRRDGERIVVIRPDRTTIGNLSQLPRNFIDMTSDAASTVFTVRPNARVSVDRVRGRLVLSVYDPPATGALPQPPPLEQTRNVLEPQSQDPAELQRTSSKPQAGEAGQATADPAAVPVRLAHADPAR